MPRLIFLLFTSAIGFAACAVGTTEGGERFSAGGAFGFGGQGGSATASTSSTTGVGGGGGEGGEDGGGGEGGEGGGDPACDFTSPNICTSAEQLSSIAGDENGPPQTATGDTSKWFKIHVTEEVSSIFEEDLSYTVTLQSPPGMDYDLKVYQGPQDGAQDCTVSPFLGDKTNGLSSVHKGWDDDQGVFGEDDSVWLSIEVVYVSGDLCGTDHSWTLTVEGHT